MAMSIFDIDDGWQLEYRENTINTAAFLGGLDSVLAARGIS